MSWNLRIGDADSKRRVSVTLSYGSRAIGMVTLSKEHYASICRELIMFIRNESFEVIKKVFHERLFADAVSTFEDPEKAKKELLRFGWNEEKLEQYATELSSRVAQILADNLPEYLR